jgi:bifunctional NMN adenylyltransferase/nudix hydrolase
MTKEYDIAVFIGRFQPVHNAHVEILKKAGKLAEKVIVIIGSAYEPRSYKNPWTTQERKAMLKSVTDELEGNYIIEANRNTIYDNTAWAVRVQNIVNKHVAEMSFTSIFTPKIAIIGHKKDETSFYLDMFPQWKTLLEKKVQNLSATQIRETYFNPETCNLNWFTGVLPKSIIQYLDFFKDGEYYKNLVEEREFILSYKKKYASLPFEPIFVTTDAVVVQSGNVLMVRRGAQPGKGQLALPGGFVDASGDRSVEDAMLRELNEETGIKLQEVVLRRNIKETKVFDAVDRSLRGRTITHAFYIMLQDGEWKLPKVKGGDDATDAMWIQIGSINPEECFEDHYDILQYFVGEVK